MIKQVQFNAYGSADVLSMVESPKPEAGLGEVIIRVKAIGVNYSDILRRRNTYFMQTPLPFVPGTEVVGIIEEVGTGVTAPYIPGTRVLAILPQAGGYATHVKAMAQYCIPLPENISDEAATAIFVQGTTAQLMITAMAGELKDKSVLISAAAGGVGSILVQLAKLNGARVIAAAGTDAKLESAKSLGAEELVNYSEPGWHEKVLALTSGKGVDFAFEMVGGDVYNESLKAIAMGGKMIVYGCASGIQGSIHPEFFVDRNISQSGFNLAFFIENRFAEWQKALETVIGLLAQGKINILSTHRFLLKEAAEAHRQIEARATTGKIVLLS